MLSKDYLNKQIQAGKTWKQIAEENNIVYQTLVQIRKRLNMEINPPTSIANKEQLQKLYITQNRSIKQISDIINITKTQTYRLFKKYNIELKNKLPSKQDIIKEYNLNKLSKSKLSKKFKCSISTVNRLFKKYNIKARSNSESQLIRSTEIQKQMKAQWANPNYVQKMIGNHDNLKHKMNCLSQNQIGKISSIQKILYSILDDLKIEYEIEKTIGWWSFDCYIKKHKILIECQGDYWHSLEKTKIKDKQKASYISNNFPDTKLIYIWEHEFKCKSLVVDLIQYLTKSRKKIISFNFCDLYIKEIDSASAEMFLSKYHYAGRINKSSYKYGIFLGNKLIAVCIFSNPTRSESAKRLGCKSKELLELCRFCIHPQYQKKNLGSWTISKCSKLIKNKITTLKYLISFADTTFNHSGIIYKASNWKLDGETKPSYWYVNKDGYVMHKKTLWDHSRKSRMTEKDYARKHKYKKVNGKKKIRYILQF